VGKDYRFVEAIKVIPARTASEFVSQIPAACGNNDGDSNSIQPRQLVPAELVKTAYS